ncbi:primase C-terminal domain-containing protein, partial [Enterococcus bulliens]
TERLEIPKRSLDKVLKQLREENKIHFRVRAGRNGGIILASIHGLMRSVIQLKKERRGAYFAAISEAFGKEYTFVQTALKRLIDPNKIGVQTDLFMIDTG